MGTDPWFALRALGLSILILLTAGIPTLVLAQNNELKWESAPGSRANLPLLFIWGTLTLATVRRIYAGLYKRTKELDPADLATMPSEGKPLGNAIWGYIEALSSKKGLSIPDWRALLNKPERVTHDTPYTLDPDWKEDLTRILGQVILRFDELETMHEGHLDTIESVSEKLRDLMALPDEETLENMLQHTEELLKFAKGIKREFNSWFPEETNTTLDNVIKKLEDHFAASAALQTENDELHQEIANKNKSLQALMNDVGKWETLALLFPGTAATWKAVSSKIRELMDKTDLSPLVHLFKNPPADLTPAGLAKEFRLGLDNLEKAVQSTCPNEKLSDYSDMEDFIYKTQDFAKRSTKYWKHMSGVTYHTTNVTETDADNLRNLISPKYFPTSGPLNYDQLLAAFTQLNKERLDAITASKQPAPGRAPCTHPEDLSHILTGNDQQNWTDSLTQVQDLIIASRNPPPAPPGGNNQEERLFSTNDVPKLTDDDDYWTYRRSFEIFANAATVAPHQLATAMARIQNRFEGKRRSYIMAYDFNNNLQPTWTATWRALLKYMDARFLDRDAHLELYKKWLTLRAKDTLWGQEFIAEFDRIRMTLNQIAPLQGKTTITDDKSLERLMDKLPKRVRDEVRYKHPNAEYQLMDDTDTTTLGDVYDWVIDEWKHLHNTGQLEQSKNAPKKSSGGSKASDGSTSNRSPNANSPPRSPGSSSHPVWGTCNKPCWDSETIVPNGYRGPYMGIQRGRDNICPRCRRGKNEHGGHPDGCQHYGAHHWHDKPASRSADPSGNDTGDN